MKKYLICALALSGFAASAQAADLGLDGLKDPLPDTISYAGVTFYGTVDVGYAYQSHGYDYSPYWINGLNYQPKPSALSASSTLPALPGQSVLTNNALSTSTIGVKVEESIGYGFVAIGKLETGINPLSGELGDGPKSLIQAKGVVAPQLPAAYNDSARAGQLLNGEAYAGLSSSTYGTLTFGRQNSLSRDEVLAYDPAKGSVAFSLIGNSGTPLQGTGDTESSFWDNSVKYVYQYGPVHGAVLYSNGTDGEQLLGYGIAGNVGFNFKGLSVDGYYTKENAAVGLDSAAAAFTNGFKYTISNNEAWSVAAKYGIDLGGGFKDEPGAKLTFYGGWVRVDLSNPDHAQSYYTGQSTIGGYGLTAPTSGTGLAYVTDRILETAWVGATYETGPWAFTGAYYHENQNTFKTNNTTIGGTALSLGGDINWVSGIVDYKFNKHFDVYAGVSWVDFSGDWTHAAPTATIGHAGSGPGASLPVTDEFNVATGVRLKF